jgi:DNA-binding NarL/FixJ family response regulator
MPPIILSLAQARDLQKQPGAWPNGWHFLLKTPIPDQPDMILDEAREEAALEMMARGCSDDQISKQLRWKAPNLTVRPLRRLYNMMNRKTRKG